MLELKVKFNVWCRVSSINSLIKWSKCEPQILHFTRLYHNNSIMLLVTALLIKDNMFTWLVLIYLQVCGHFRERDRVRCIKGQLVAAGPELLHHFWSHCDVLGNISSDHGKTGQQHFITVNPIGHICTCRKKMGEIRNIFKQFKSKQYIWEKKVNRIQTPKHDAFKQMYHIGQDELWYIMVILAPTCNYFHLDLNWLSVKGFAIGCMER